ncbi:site-specific integrase [Nocardioides anomalus]|uniref:Site-specific integrase n=1 Tax=Nocardioides anomalus TaxID=2712223 RepID=A0A6G6WAJ7_9ACTN|nr:site-specific integrase [Nocardioides anomalus]QIG42060.1 site-specific integrase [Nocardioides anomalus]
MQEPRRLSVVDNRASSMTVASYLEEWLWAKQSLRASTFKSYESHVRNYLVPYVGHHPLGELRPAHLDKMYRELASREDQRLSVSTLRRVHATLLSALSTAVKRGQLERNPASAVELPQQRRREPVTWTAKDLQAFLQAVQSDPLHPLFLLLAVTGLRRGEVIALRWRDVDLNLGRLSVRQAAVLVGGRVVVGEPKSRSGHRTIAVDDETCRRLTWHKRAQELAVSRVLAPPQRPELVFSDEHGEALDPAHVSRRFVRLVHACGLPRIRLHDLRHTSASLGLASGESLVEVSRRLGHSSLSVTADIYSHISPEVAKHSAERLAASIYGDEPITTQGGLR